MNTIVSFFANPWIFFGLLVVLIIWVRLTHEDHNDPVVLGITITIVILLVLSLISVIGGIFKNPTVQEHASIAQKRTETIVAEGTLYMKKGILESEVTQGVFGTLKENSACYDQKGSLIENLKLKEGQKIKAIDMKGFQINGAEGMTLVALPDKNGDFTANSGKVYLPLRKISWEDKKDNADEPKPIELPTETVIQPQPITIPEEISKPELPPQKQEIVATQQSQYSLLPTLPLRLRHSSQINGTDTYVVKKINRTKNALIIECNNNLKLEGTSLGDGVYQGTWTQTTRDGKCIQGPFTLKFESPNKAKGKIGEPEGFIPLELFSVL